MGKKIDYPIKNKTSKLVCRIYYNKDATQFNEINLYFSYLPIKVVKWFLILYSNLIYEIEFYIYLKLFLFLILNKMK